MKQFLLPEGVVCHGGTEIKLGRKDTHYIKNVLRLKSGSVFTVMDRESSVCSAALVRFENESAVIMTEPADLSIEIKNREIPEIPEIVLFPCLLKGKKMDLVIRQAAEAGASIVVPLISGFSVAKLEEKNRQGRIERWRKIAREAIQQSGSRILTRIEEPLELVQLNNFIDSLEFKEKVTSLFFHEKSIENKSLHQYLESGSDRVNILTGPEGGLSGKETEWLIENNFSPAYLGSNTLRAETAAIYALAVVKTILLEKKTWKTTA